MDRKEAQARFVRAVELYRRKEFNEALTIFQQLQTVMPDEPELLYPQAMCLAAVNRLGEAEGILRHLQGRVDSAKLKKLKSRIEGMQTGVGADEVPPLPPLSSLPPRTPIPIASPPKTGQAPPERAPAHPRQTAKSSSIPVIPLIAGVVLAAGLAGAGYWFFGNRGQSTVQYNNPKFGLSFEYPASWHVKEFGGSPLLPDAVLMSRLGEPENFLPEANVSISGSGTIGGASQTTVRSRTSYDFGGIAITIRNLDLFPPASGGGALLEFMNQPGFVDQLRQMLKDGEIAVPPGLSTIAGRDAAVCELRGKTATEEPLNERLVLIKNENQTPVLIAAFYLQGQKREYREVEAKIVASLSAVSRHGRDVASAPPAPQETPHASQPPAATPPPNSSPAPDGTPAQSAPAEESAPPPPASTASTFTIDQADEMLARAAKYLGQGDSLRGVATARMSHSIKLNLLGADHPEVKAIESLIASENTMGAPVAIASSGSVSTSAANALDEITTYYRTVAQYVFVVTMEAQFEVADLREMNTIKASIFVQPIGESQPRFLLKSGDHRRPLNSMTSDGTDFIGHDPAKNVYAIARKSEGASTNRFLAEASGFLRAESALFTAVSMFLPINPEAPSHFQTVQELGMQEVNGRDLRRLSLAGQGEQADLWVLDGKKPLLERADYIRTEYLTGSAGAEDEDAVVSSLLLFFGGDPARFTAALSRLRATPPPHAVKIRLSLEFKDWMASSTASPGEFPIQPPEGASPLPAGAR